MHREKFTCEPRLLLGLARIYDMLNDPETAITYYKKVVVYFAFIVGLKIPCFFFFFFLMLDSFTVNILLARAYFSLLTYSNLCVL